MNITPTPSGLRAMKTEAKLWLLIAVATVIGWPICRAIWSYWSDDHLLGGRGLFVTVLSLWLVYRVRGHIASAPVRPELRLIWILVACGVALLGTEYAAGPNWAAIFLPALILLASLSALGWAVTRLVAVPVAFLYLALPIWDQLLSGPLQAVTLWVTSWAVPLIGIPATIVGATIFLPAHMSFQVTGGCSGVGFLVEAVTIAALLGELENASLRRRIVLVTAIIPVALVANWLRVLAIVYVGYSTEMRHVFVTRYHKPFGYVIFTAVLLLFLALATQRREHRGGRATCSGADLH